MAMWISDLQVGMMSNLELLCYPDTVAYDTETMREILERPGVMLVCEWREGQLAGFQVNDTSCATVITIDVHPDFRRLGIATLLMRKSLPLFRAAGLRRVCSQVGVTNVASIMLHLKFGFKQRHRLKNYYGPGDDAILLVKEV